MICWFLLNWCWGKCSLNVPMIIIFVHLSQSNFQSCTYKFNRVRTIFASDWFSENPFSAWTDLILESRAECCFLCWKGFFFCSAYVQTPKIQVKQKELNHLWLNCNLSTAANYLINLMIRTPTARWGLFFFTLKFVEITILLNCKLLWKLWPVNKNC